MRVSRQTPYDINNPPLEKTVHADRGDAGMRLDKFVRRMAPWRSRTSVQALLAEARVVVNGEPKKASYRLKDGDAVTLRFPKPTDEETPVEVPLHVIHEDEDVLVLNKQPGVTVHPVGRIRYNTVVNALYAKYRNFEDPERDIVPRLGHRLDKNTSGVLIVLKNEEAARRVHRQFQNRKAQKEYVALVEGNVERDEDELDMPIGSDESSPIWIKRGVRPDGLPSVTRYRVARRWQFASLVHVRPKTGRLHQIRVHMSATGHPVLCDHMYGVRERLLLSDIRSNIAPDDDRCLLGRQALHCARMTIVHPGRNEHVTFEAPLPDDMGDVIEAFDRYLVGGRP